MNPRARSWSLAVIGMLALAAGVVLQWVEVAAIGLAIAALPVIALAARPPRSASWRDLAAPTRVTRGDEASLRIEVTVPSGSWVSAVDDLGATRRFVDQAGTSELVWAIDTRRRGLREVGPSRLESGDPFGLHRRTLATRPLSPVLVVPRVFPVEVLATLAAGEDAEAERSGSDHFHSLREYVPGDPMKSIHWRSSARTGTLMVRRTVESTVPQLLIVLDVNARAYDHAGALFADFDADGFERAVDTAASWAWSACSAHQRVLLTTTSIAATQVDVTVRNRESALDWLALVTEEPQERTTGDRVTVLARRNEVAHTVLVTGGHDGRSSGWRDAWRRHTTVHVVRGDS